MDFGDFRDFREIVGSRPVVSDSLVLWPAHQEIRLVLDVDWRDHRGEPYHPSVHLAFRAWNDDTVTVWSRLEIDDYVLVGDTIIIHLDRLILIDAQLRGANFSFRVRLSSAGVQTDWVRLAESIRFYDRERRGIPRQPRGLRLIR